LFRGRGLNTKAQRHEGHKEQLVFEEFFGTQAALSFSFKKQTPKTADSQLAQ